MTATEAHIEGQVTLEHPDAMIGIPIEHRVTLLERRMSNYEMKDTKREGSAEAQAKQLSQVLIESGENKASIRALEVKVDKLETNMGNALFELNEKQDSVEAVVRRIESSYMKRDEILNEFKAVKELVKPAVDNDAARSQSNEEWANGLKKWFKTVVFSCLTFALVAGGWGIYAVLTSRADKITRQVLDTHADVIENRRIAEKHDHD